MHDTGSRCEPVRPTLVHGNSQIKKKKGQLADQNWLFTRCDPDLIEPHGIITPIENDQMGLGIKPVLSRRFTNKSQLHPALHKPVLWRGVSALSLCNVLPSCCLLELQY